MHKAQINSWGEVPKYIEVEELPPPKPEEVRLTLLATGVHRVVQSRATGEHYTSRQLPHTPGVDGVGQTEDGKRVYFSSFSVGSMSEAINIPKQAVTPLPDGLDPTQVAGLSNPALSSWMSLRIRVQNLPKDFSVLILGATSTSGRIAIFTARYLGAKWVIGAARNKSSLETLGLDDTIVVKEHVEETDVSAADDVDFILDYFSGPLTSYVLRSLKSTRPIQYVQIGAVSGLTNLIYQQTYYGRKISPFVEAVQELGATENWLLRCRHCWKR